jgi:hypothetical protein
MPELRPACVEVERGRQPGSSALESRAVRALRNHLRRRLASDKQIALRLGDV